MLGEEFSQLWQAMMPDADAPFLRLSLRFWTFLMPEQEEPPWCIVVTWVSGSWGVIWIWCWVQSFCWLRIMVDISYSEFQARAETSWKLIKAWRVWWSNQVLFGHVSIQFHVTATGLSSLFQKWVATFWSGNRSMLWILSVSRLNEFSQCPWMRRREKTIVFWAWRSIDIALLFFLWLLHLQHQSWA